ncbi:hypothetical protein A8P42_00655 [Treponema pallidum subsp. pallidum]|nr:hypothetical protein SD16_00645 [Treponema pallidum subsp. pallidum]ANI48933.1 hypothetical protein SD18_00650 [Treponema pallidum subsp. pallidum]ANI49907.1 hypothetical protein SD19_00650 [Treponema pallidum subsp. pallidum]AOF55141.1 hypothetical protein A8P23_00655 [Treponema pallidum subsp. pallidum]AOF56113.1 hypothetical protein A9Z46_00655 [Treponema pallidum subsp. pallidum]
MLLLVQFLGRSLVQFLVLLLLRSGRQDIVGIAPTHAARLFPPAQPPANILWVACPSTPKPEPWQPESHPEPLIRF